MEWTRQRQTWLGLWLLLFFTLCKESESAGPPPPVGVGGSGVITADCLAPSQTPLDSFVGGFVNDDVAALILTTRILQAVDSNNTIIPVTGGNNLQADVFTHFKRLVYGLTPTAGLPSFEQFDLTTTAPGTIGSTLALIPIPVQIIALPDGSKVCALNQDCVIQCVDSSGTSNINSLE
jgi:hypothetical protein